MVGFKKGHADRSVGLSNRQRLSTEQRTLIWMRAERKVVNSWKPDLCGSSLRIEASGRVGSVSPI